jgi:hypothetical protein
MAAVSIRQGLVSGDPLAQVPRHQWPELMEMRRMFCKRSLPGDCRLLLQFIEDGRAGDFAGYAGEEDYIREGLGLDPEAVRWAVEGLEITGSEVPVPFAQAVRLGKHGGDRKSKAAKDQDQVDIVNLKHEGGNSAAYLAARLERDEPEIKAALDRGEYPSVRAAAKAAGIVRDKTPLENLRKWWAKASEDERLQFRDEIDRPVMDRRYR